VKKEVWRLSWWARALVIVLIAFILGLIFVNANSFLTVTERIDAKILIVDGWAPSYTMKQATSEYLSGGYQQVFVVRGVYDLQEKYETGRAAGTQVAELLVKYGIPKEVISIIFFSATRRDRTYNSALALKTWLAENKVSANRLNLATLGTHSRRSRLLYNKAFGGAVQVGIIALENRAYDSSKWWSSSEGARDVIGEGIAYAHAKLLFNCKKVETQQKTRLINE
jgi:hypothetical protein